MNGRIEEKKQEGTNGTGIHQNGTSTGEDEQTKTLEDKDKDRLLLSPKQENTEPSKVLKLSPAKIHELTNSPTSLPFRAATPVPEEIPLLADTVLSPTIQTTDSHTAPFSPVGSAVESVYVTSPQLESDVLPHLPSIKATPGAVTAERPRATSRSASSPLIRRKHAASTSAKPTQSRDQSGSRRQTLSIRVSEQQPPYTNGVPKAAAIPEPLPSPMPAVIPLPPLSLPTYLQLELSPERPSALYIHRSASSDFPYESSRIKFERLLNFLLLPPQLEQVLWFGALACLDAWLYTFTILPLRFMKALWMLVQWSLQNAVKEVREVWLYVYKGFGRFWQRQRQTEAGSRRPSAAESETTKTNLDAVSSALDARESGDGSSDPRQTRRPRKASNLNRHRRVKSTPSALLPNHKADLLHGLLIICSCLILIRFDASRMYHGIRGQAAIKLYVIYNVLEVCDRLFSALGQDVLECLFSKETLERKPNGRSKIIRPAWMFVLALVYNVLHAAALFYQVITLNVAVNSYSNALLTLLMSNQFVEIKGTVFKKFEKENLFQLTCADVVERFQLWLMLLVIALRNIVEVGGLTISSSSTSSSSATTSPTNFTNTTTSAPAFSTSILPSSFTLLPSLFGAILSPFLIVLGSEMLVDWLKHAYINKFNNFSPTLYSRFLDVLAKDYYSHAFADQNLTKRLGLPVLPLACLWIRATVQAYQGFLATHVPLPLPSPATGLAVGTQSAATSPATTAALQHIDQMFRRALGRSAFGAGGAATTGFWWSWSWSSDDAIALATMLLFFLVLYLVLLALKLVLGMCLLGFARRRYAGMKERERAVYETGGRRVGGWGTVEVDEEKRRWIYEGDEEGLAKLRERDARGREEREGKREGKGDRLDGVGRYMMAAKRIW